MKLKLLTLFLLVMSSLAMGCPPCPSGSSTTGTGGSTNLPGCKCTNSSYAWTGSACVSCPAGTSISGAGATANPTACKCNTSGQYWNGSSCYSCPAGTSPTGAGGAASPAACKCNTSGQTWNGSSCVTPPSGGACTLYNSGPSYYIISQSCDIGGTVSGACCAPDTGCTGTNSGCTNSTTTCPSGMTGTPNGQTKCSLFTNTGTYLTSITIPSGCSYYGYTSQTAPCTGRAYVACANGTLSSSTVYGYCQ